jgi:hypothetical protein
MLLRFDPGIEIVHGSVPDPYGRASVTNVLPNKSEVCHFLCYCENHRHYENGTCKDPRFTFLPSCLAGTRDGREQGENENVGQALDRRLQ